MSGSQRPSLYSERRQRSLSLGRSRRILLNNRPNKRPVFVAGQVRYHLFMLEHSLQTEGKPNRHEIEFQLGQLLNPGILKNAPNRAMLLE
jgi:hypothetical protein